MILAAGGSSAAVVRARSRSFAPHSATALAIVYAVGKTQNTAGARTNRTGRNVSAYPETTAAPATTRPRNGSPFRPEFQALTKQIPAIRCACEIHRSSSTRFASGTPDVR